MRRPMVVTGGSGFIGSAFIRSARSDAPILNVDKGTYAADVRRLEGRDVETIALDVASSKILDLFDERRPSVIVHFAAETHVTRSEKDPLTFLHTNVEGTRRLLEAAERCGADLVVHVSTDEVYGPAIHRPFLETDKVPGEGLATSSYARSKALADDLAASARIPVIVVRPTNCFGPWQHPEKAIPRWTIRALRGETIPVWGDGTQVRDWMYVEDASDAISSVIAAGVPGEIYNVGPQGEVHSNLEMATYIAEVAEVPSERVYLSAYDRPNHDHRYSVDASKLRALGWTSRASLHERLRDTVRWYQQNSAWWPPLIAQAEGLYEDDQPRETA